MSRALRCGAPRMFRTHGGVPGRWFREHYTALAQRLGPFDALSRFYAGAVCVLWVTVQEDARALEEAVRVRQQGKGRRPSAAGVARLKKRQGLSWQSYGAALAKLEDLTKSNGRPKRPMAALADEPEATA